MSANRCWCGNSSLEAFSPGYLICHDCGTLVASSFPSREVAIVKDDLNDFYGREYWLSHQVEDLGHENIEARARSDLYGRCLHWLRALLTYKLPPAKILELGSAHGGFVGLMRQAGYDAVGLELSPWVVDFATREFGVPMLQGPVEDQSLAPQALDGVVMMDVLEHLIDPLSTVGHCLELLRRDGILVIQTPSYPRGRDHTALVSSGDRFREMLRPDEHLYLFSHDSIRLMLSRLGVDNIVFEPAYFADYDMFLIASRNTLTRRPDTISTEAILHRPNGRFVQALLDMDDEVERLKKVESERNSLEALTSNLTEQLAASEADRAARLRVIEQQGEELARTQVEAHNILRQLTELQQRLKASMGDASEQASSAREQSELTASAQAPHTGLEMGRPPLSAVDSGGQTSGSDPEDRQASRVSQDPQPSATIINKEGRDIPLVYPEIPNQQRHGSIAYTTEIVENIVRGLLSRGVDVESLEVDVPDFRSYFSLAEYERRYPDYYSWNVHEKALEHYLASKLLDLTSGDVYVDVASEGSPVPEIYARLFGCTSYRQDLAYPPGINDTTIGGDAAEMPVPDGFATKVALHCSLEHFEGNADAQFIEELDRILVPGGKACVVPLYMFTEYAILTDPAVSIPAHVEFDQDAIVYCDTSWKNRHARFYDPRHFAVRIVDHLHSLKLKVYRITNVRRIDPSCYAEFAALIMKPAAG